MTPMPDQPDLEALDLEALKRVAEAATPGPWFHVNPGMVLPKTRTIHGPVPAERVDFVSTHVGLGTPPGHRVVVPMEGSEVGVRTCDMAHIATFDPPTVLSLIALVEREKARAEKAERQWRCFQCDEVFTGRECAKAHFGEYQDCRPACKIGVEQFRKMEEELASWRSESDAASKEFYGLGAKHAGELRREEEKGYERGLRDAGPDALARVENAESALTAERQKRAEVEAENARLREGMKEAADSYVNMLHAQSRDGYSEIADQAVNVVRWRALLSTDTEGAGT